VNVSEESSTPIVTQPATKLWLVALAFVLLSWILGHHISLPANSEGLMKVNYGLHLFLSGALPWLLQWAALALLFRSVAGRDPLLHPAALRCGAWFALLPGVLWWTVAVVIHWGASPLDAILETASRAVRATFGGESLFYYVLHDVLGPLVFPLALHGTYSLHGDLFALAGLSTTLVMAYWIWAGRWTSLVGGGESTAASRPWARVGIALLIYFLPVWLRSGVSLLRHFES
jgi:hypothetical protein